MQAWQVQDAKARFSEFLEARIADGPQMVTRRGEAAAVLVPVGEWRRLQSAARPSLKQLLLSDAGRTDDLTPPRGTARRRKVAALRCCSSYNALPMDGETIRAWTIVTRNVGGFAHFNVALLNPFETPPA